MSTGPPSPGRTAGHHRYQETPDPAHSAEERPMRRGHLGVPTIFTLACPRTKPQARDDHPDHAPDPMGRPAPDRRWVGRAGSCRGRGQAKDMGGSARRVKLSSGPQPPSTPAWSRPTAASHGQPQTNPRRAIFLSRHAAGRAKERRPKSPRATIAQQNEEQHRCRQRPGPRTSQRSGPVGVPPRADQVPACRGRHASPKVSGERGRDGPARKALLGGSARLVRRGGVPTRTRAPQP